MAITLEKRRFSVDLGSVIQSSIVAVLVARRSEQARKEAEFQRAIADGLSYDEQIALRQAHLEEAKKSSFTDVEYIASLEKAITDTKRLNRFNKYRVRYAETLGELGAGKINEEEYLSILKGQLVGVTTPELRLEIQRDISTAEAKVKTYKDTILSNQIKKARFDGTKAALDSIISRVIAARANALINDDEEEVTAYDETLSALRSQLTTVRIQDSITDFQARSATRGVDAIEKLNYISSQIRIADADVAIKVGERTFISAEQFWSIERDNFLAGNSEIFGNFFKELAVTVNNSVAVNTARFGYPTESVLDAAMFTFDELRAKPEIAPFLSNLDIVQASVMTDAIDKLANTLIDVGTSNLSFKEADIQLQNITTKFGIDTSSFRLKLDAQLRNISEDIIPLEEKRKLDPEIEIALPKIGEQKVEIAPEITPVATPEITPTPELTPTPEPTPAPIQSTQPPIQTPIPPAPILQSTQPSLQTPLPIPQSTQPSLQTPIPAPEPIQTPIPKVESTTPPTSIYTGVSIVDYLKSVGQDSSFGARQKLAGEQGIQNYTGTGKQNTELLKILRG